jgi:hypothetical protein
MGLVFFAVPSSTPIGDDTQSIGDNIVVSPKKQVTKLQKMFHFKRFLIFELTLCNK